MDKDKKITLKQAYENAKFTRGRWDKLFSSNVCIGVGVKSHVDINYYNVILNSVLPENDAAYKDSEPIILGDMNLCASAPDLLECLLSLLDEIIDSDGDSLLPSSANHIIQQSKLSICKALSIDPSTISHE